MTARIKTIAFPFFGAVAVWLVCVPTQAQEARVLLYVPFDGVLDATVAAGDPTGAFQRAGEGDPQAPEFGEGIRGQALEIGRHNYSVAYVPEGNIRPERGTITFWARRLGEPPETGYTFHYLGWNQPDGTWVWLYNWIWNPLMALHGRGGSGDVGVRYSEADDDGEWHMIGLTWDGRRARGYLDGDLAGPGADVEDFPIVGFSDFWVGRGGAGVSRLFDELRIYDQALSPAEMKREYRRIAGPEAPPYLTVPRRAAAITIDGKIEPAEWDAAAQTTGFINGAEQLVGPTPTRAWLAYDDQALYIALSSELPEGVAEQVATTIGITGILKQQETNADAAVDADDAMEVLLRPRGADGNWYRLVVNGLNTHYDYLITPEGNIQLGWNPRWESASTVDTGGWHVEMRLPFAEFAEGAPAPGDEWEINLGRFWRLLQQGKESWAVGGPRDTTPVRFGAAQEPFARLQSVGRLTDAQADVRAEVVNPSAQAASLQVAVTTDSGEVAHEEVVEVPGGERRAVRLAQRLQNPSTSLLSFEVRARETGRLVFRTQAPLMMRQLLQIATAVYPTAGLYRATFDVGRLRDIPLAHLAGRVQVLDANSNAVAEAALAPLPSYRADLHVDVSALPPAAYTVRCTVEKTGEMVAEKLVSYDKQPLPEWYGNTIGVTDKAPKPFTPVTREGSTLGVWGREYRFGDRLLPTQITTQGWQMLAGPVELLVTDAQGRAHSSAQVAAGERWGKHTDMRLDFQRQAQVGPVTARTESWLECDGLLWTKLSLRPANVEISAMTLRIPLKKEWSEYINAFDYSTQTTGRLSRVSPDGRAVGSPCWLGNGTGGLQWVAETTLHWRLAEGTAAAEVIVGEEHNVLQLTFINVPTSLVDGFEVEWGLIATPVRPPTPGYRTWLTRLLRPGTYYPGYQWYVPTDRFADPRWLEYSHFIGSGERPDGKGQYVVSSGPYVVTQSCWPGVPEFEYWGDEWSPSRLGRRGDECSVGCPSWGDFLVWCYRKAYDRGRFVGLYYDCAMYLPDDNHYHGQGLLRDGAWHPATPVLGAREVAKRLYCMLRELEPEQTMILYHHSGQVNMAVLSWCDVYVDGENFTSRLTKTECDYHRLFPPDAFLAQSRGHNFGPANWFLDEFSRAKAIASDEEWAAVGSQPVDHLFGLVLLHDSGYWMAYGRGYEHTVEVLRRCAFDERYEMIPYWEQRVVDLPEGVFATFYRDPGAKRVILVLLNNNEENMNLRLALDWKALGFEDPGRVKVDDTWAARATPPQDPAKEADVPLCAALASIEDGRLVTPVGHANMRLLVLEE
jgi:hypothetical protein